MSTLMLGEGLEIAEMAHQLGAKVIAGSAHPSMFPADMMKHDCVDAVVIGEGEVPLVKHLKMWRLVCVTPSKEPMFEIERRKRSIKSKERNPVLDLDSLPFPAWDLIDMDAYFDAWGQLDSVQPGLQP